MSSGATTSAGRQKKDWGRFWEGAVAMGVAWGANRVTLWLPTSQRKRKKAMQTPSVRARQCRSCIKAIALKASQDVIS